MQTPVLTKTYLAEAAVTPHRVVKHGADDVSVLMAAAATDALLGVSGNLAAAQATRVEVVLAGITEVELGAAVARGQLLTADAQGRAVPAAPAVGVNARVVGVAMASGALGDIAPVLLAPAQVQG